MNTNEITEYRETNFWERKEPSIVSDFLSQA